MGSIPPVEYVNGAKEAGLAVMLFGPLAIFSNFSLARTQPGLTLKILSHTRQSIVMCMRKSR